MTTHLSKAQQATLDVLLAWDDYRAERRREAETIRLLRNHFHEGQWEREWATPIVQALYGELPIEQRELFSRWLFKVHGGVIEDRLGLATGVAFQAIA